VANYHSNNTVSLLLGNGNGTFQSAQNFNVGSYPESAAVADVNGDGRPDLVVANYRSNTVSVLLGNGDGTFASATNFIAGSGPFAVAVADVNRDGVPDLVTADSSGASVSVLLGQPNAATHFQVSAPASVTAGTPFTVTVTALTAGGQLDAVYTGTAHFTSSDGKAVLPADYTFTLADAGSHTFTVTLNTTGSRTVKATDKHDSSLTGKAVVKVNAPAPASPAPARQSDGGTGPVDQAAAAAALDSFWRSDGTAGLPGEYPLVSAEEGTHPSTATGALADRPVLLAPARSEGVRLRSGLAAVTVPAAGRTASVGPLLGVGAAGLDPVGVEAFFAEGRWEGAGAWRLGEQHHRP
jgi:hypothetical protein